MDAVYPWNLESFARCFTTIAGTTKDEAGRRVTQEALKAFQDEYVTGAELAASVGSRSRRWSSEHLMVLGFQPVSGPSVDGARQFLFRRADVDKARLRPVRQFTVGNPTPVKANEALVLVRAVGRAAARELGLELRQISNRFVDNIGFTVVQVVTGRRNGLSGAYRFIISASQIRCLQAARSAYIALGLIGQLWFLMVSWQDAQAILRWRSTSGADVFVNVDGRGRPKALSEFERNLT